MLSIDYSLDTPPFSRRAKVQLGEVAVIGKCSTINDKYVPTTGILSNYLLATYRKSVSILSRAINDKAADKAEISLIQSLF